MDQGVGFLMIGIAGAMILLVTAMRSRTELLLNVILRGVLGLLAVYFVNAFMEASGISLHVGIGVPSALVSGVLGMPGVLLMYGIDLCAHLLV